MYTIGETSKKLNISPHTLRYYDREGLFPFVERTEHGVRIFKESDFERLYLIKCLKSSCMPLKLVKQFVDWYMEGDSTLQKRRDTFHEQKKVVEEQMQDLQKILNLLTYKCWIYDKSVQAGTSLVYKNLKPEDFPDEIRKIKEQLPFT